MNNDSTSSKIRKKVISTRPSAPGDAELAKRHNIDLVDCPAYYYEWITPPRQVTEAILRKARPGAWVFTSSRGVEGWWRAWKKITGMKQKNEITGQSKQAGELFGGETHGEAYVSGGITAEIPPVYVLGDKTREIFEFRFPSVKTCMGETQNAVALGMKIVTDGIGSVAHFCSTDRRKELREICQKSGVGITEVEVYRSCAVTDPMPVKDPVDAVFFFSPNGVSEFKRLYGTPKGDWLAVAVGPTTAEKVQDVTGKVPKVAESPSFQEMLKLL